MKIELKGKTHAVDLGSVSFADREDLIMNWQNESGKPRRQMFALIAAIGLCTDLGSHSNLGSNLGRAGLFEMMNHDSVKFGRLVYSKLMEQGHKRDEIISCSVQIIEHICLQLFPRESEVKEAVDFTKHGAQQI